MGAYIQSIKLPRNWKKLVQKYDISYLSSQTQSIIDLLKKQIDYRQNEALTDKRIASFVQDIVFGKAKVLKNADKNWSKLPQDLINDMISEFGNIKDMWEFFKRHDSMYTELKAYEVFLEEGYAWEEFKRNEGSCDLTMIKDSNIYNIEVKFKENEDTFLSRIYMYINGMSLLDDYKFIREKMITIDLKTQKLDNITRKHIIKDVREFLDKKEKYFDGSYIRVHEGQIPPRDNPIIRDKNVNYDSSYTKFKISQTYSKEDVCTLINKIFLRKDGHINKMKKKSLRYSNFIGFLSWSHPFYHEIDISEIEQCFKSLKLNFKLYVDIQGFGVNSKLLRIQRETVKTY